VLTCPTGIDIRDGLQMECIHCTQCADACDDIMDRVGTPRGLIRYSSRDELEGKPKKLLRPRVILYPAALAIAVSLFIYFLGTKEDTDVTILRGIGAPYTLEADGRVINQVRVRVTNRAERARQYRIEVGGADGAQVIAPENPLEVAAGELRTTSLFIVAPPSMFDDGERAVRFTLSDGAGYTATFEYNLIGPDDDDRDRVGREKDEGTADDK
jgi:cytochrome c oxidase accessory protein FixG